MSEVLSCSWRLIHVTLLSMNVIYIANHKPYACVDDWDLLLHCTFSLWLPNSPWRGYVTGSHPGGEGGHSAMPWDDVNHDTGQCTITCERSTQAATCPIRHSRTCDGVCSSSITQQCHESQAPCGHTATITPQVYTDQTGSVLLSSLNPWWYAFSHMPKLSRLTGHSHVWMHKPQIIQVKHVRALSCMWRQLHNRFPS